MTTTQPLRSTQWSIVREPRRILITDRDVAGVPASHGGCFILGYVEWRLEGL